MDMETFKHLATWIDHQFGTRMDIDACFRLARRMEAVYDSDPEFYRTQSWWNAYNVARDPD